MDIYPFDRFSLGTYRASYIIGEAGFIIEKLIRVPCELCQSADELDLLWGENSLAEVIANYIFKHDEYSDDLKMSDCLLRVLNEI